MHKIDITPNDLDLGKWRPFKLKKNCTLSRSIQRNMAGTLLHVRSTLSGNMTLNYLDLGKWESFWRLKNFIFALFP